MWNFRVFQHICRKCIVFLLFVFSLFNLFKLFQKKTKTEKKKPNFAVICPFLSQIKRWFSVFYRYIGQITPHPPFLALAGWVSSRPKFFIFLFFVKYYDFTNSAFLPNFEHFREYHIYFSFCIKFHSIYFCLFLCVR